MEVTSYRLYIIIRLPAHTRLLDIYSKDILNLLTMRSINM
jgi:hypothetical protein